MTKKKNPLFDNLLKIIEGVVVLTGTTTVSLEIDFELPRGFVARIHHIIMRAERINEDFEAISVDKLARISFAVLRDPDDSTTTSVPSNETQHDVIMDHEVEILIVAGTAGDPGIYVSKLSREKSFVNAGGDMITARNMRINAVGGGTDGGDLTESLAIAHVEYTLEEVELDFILDILDIL